MDIVMTDKDQIILDGLFRDLVEVVSSSETSLISLRCLGEAIDQLDCSADEIFNQIDTATEVILNSRPRMFPLDNQIPFFRIRLRESGVTGDVDAVKREAKRILDELGGQLKADMEKLKEHGSACVEDGDIIIIHSVEEPVEMLIPKAGKQGKDFEVLILKQDIAKTRQVIKIMNREEIKYRVVPEYDLVHYFDEATKLFIGAQAVTSDGRIVADSGTSNIVSESHIHKLPIYLFTLTLEFSGKGADEQNIYLKQEPQSDDGLEYTLMSHSHDIVRLDLMDHIITEKGEIPKDDLYKHNPDQDRG